MSKVLIDQMELLQLLKDSSALQSLNYAGVDNWSGIDCVEYDEELLYSEELPPEYCIKPAVWTVESEWDLGYIPPHSSKDTLESYVKVMLDDLMITDSFRSYEDVRLSGLINYVSRPLT